MRLELPELRRCCLCLPLRRGVLAWAYIDFIAHILLIFSSIRMLIVFWEYMSHLFIVVAACTLILHTTTAVYYILVIVSCHKKNAKLLRISTKCGVMIWIALIILTLLSLCVNIYIFTSMSQWRIHDEIYRKVLYKIFGLFVADLVAICFNGYIILLLRSEILKLEDQSLKVEFVNNAAEIQARCVRAHDSVIYRENMDNE